MTMRRARVGHPLLRVMRRHASSSNSVTSLRPDEVVAALDKHIVGQPDAKIAVAIALRDQWRRQKLSVDLQREVLPNNILMIGPTGVGKTEVARRLAHLAYAPFVKVEATKYTEVGIYGADTSSMVEDLVDAAVRQVEERAREEARAAARKSAIERVVAALGWRDESERDSIRQLISDGKMDDQMVEMELPPTSSGRGSGGSPLDSLPMLAGMPKGLQDALRSATAQISSESRRGGQPRSGSIILDLGKMQDKDSGIGPDGGKAGSGGERRERVRIGDALPRWEEAEIDDTMEEIDVDATAIEHAEQRGIIFVDEIDKLVRRDGGGGGGSAFYKGEGVQKELLGLIEGTAVRTPRGLINTSHILFICAGAFHMAKPADLLPELQGRLPVRVELKPLTEADFVRILSDTKFNLLLQQQRLLETEDVELRFTECAVAEIASLAAQVNMSVENIGARRLRTVLAKIMENLSFTAPHLSGTEVVIDAAYVKARSSDMATNVDMQKYIL